MRFLKALGTLILLFTIGHWTIALIGAIGIWFFPLVAFLVLFVIPFGLALAVRCYEHESKREERIFRDLPSPDMEHDAAAAYVKQPRFTGLPGSKNSALTRYLDGTHDAAEMERMLDARIGLKPRGFYIKLHEHQLQRDREIAAESAEVSRRARLRSKW